MAKMVGTQGNGDDGSSEKDDPSKIRALHDVAVDLVSCGTDREVFERAIGAADDLLEFDQSAIYVQEGEKLVAAAVASDELTGVSDAPVFDRDEGMMGYTYRTGESVVVDDAHAHERAAPTNAAIQSGLCVPMGDIGVFNAISDTPGEFDDGDLALAEILAAHATSAVKRIRSTAETERERNRFAALFENIPDAAVIAELSDGETRIRQVNAAFEEVFGVDRDAVAGDPVADHVRLPDGESRIDLTGSDGAVVREIRREAADGVREFLFRGFTVETSRETQYYGLFTDITERKARKRDLEGKTQRLEEFASIVSHDLRSPLATASGWLELAEDRADGDVADAVGNAAHSLDRMESLIDDLLTISREGWTVDERLELEGEHLVREAWTGIPDGNGTLDCEWAGTVEADRERFVELMENLLRNCVEHGGESPYVRVGPLSDTDGIFVADDGPGIDPGVADSLFEMGVSGDSDGTGLGLAIVDRIATAHGWEITVTEPESGGTRFELRFDAEPRD